VIRAEIPFKAEIVFNENRLFFSGPEALEKKINNQRQKNGDNPIFWKVISVLDGYDVLLNEFILRCQNNYKITYLHEEICHCRMISTEKILNTIKQGVFSTSEISRLTMAGTGCGSCKKDIDELLNYLVK